MVKNGSTGTMTKEKMQILHKAKFKWHGDGSSFIIDGKVNELIAYHKESNDFNERNLQNLTVFLLARAENGEKTFLKDYQETYLTKAGFFINTSQQHDSTLPIPITQDEAVSPGITPSPTCEVDETTPSTNVPQQGVDFGRVALFPQVVNGLVSISI